MTPWGSYSDIKIHGTLFSDSGSGENSAILFRKPSCISHVKKAEESKGFNMIYTPPSSMMNANEFSPYLSSTAAPSSRAP